MSFAWGGSSNHTEKAKRMRSLLSLCLLSAASSQGPSGTCGLESCGTACAPPPYPPIHDLPDNPFLPNPFKNVDGSIITKKAQYICRRDETSRYFQHYEIGLKPPKPMLVTGTVSKTQITVIAGNGTTNITFTAMVQLPTVGSAPYPSLIGIGGISLNAQALRAMGIAIVSFNNNDIAAQNNPSSRGQGKFYNLYGPNHPAGALTAWAWGVSRLIDVIETSGSSILNVSAVAVSGCSRNGKGALFAGALDERIALTIPQESGSGGSGCWRITQAGGIDPINGTVIPWFTPNFTQFDNNLNKIPFDHHQLHGLVAPRGLLVVESDQIFNIPQSTWGCSVAGTYIYEALGVADHMGVAMSAGNNHCQFPLSQQQNVTNFVSKFLLGNMNVNTTVMNSGGTNVTFNKTQWVDWPTPTLE